MVRLSSVPNKCRDGMPFCEKCEANTTTGYPFIVQSKQDKKNFKKAKSNMTIGTEETLNL